MFEQTIQVLNEFMPKLVQAISEEVDKKGIKASGNFQRSLRSTIERKGESLIAQIIGHRYGLAVNLGRGKTVNSGPGHVKKAIRKWVDQKGITPGTITLKSGKNRKLTKDELVFLITRKIHEQGFEAKPFIDDAVEPFLENFKQQLRNTLISDIKRELQPA